MAKCAECSIKAQVKITYRNTAEQQLEIYLCEDDLKYWLMQAFNNKMLIPEFSVTRAWL